MTLFSCVDCGEPVNYVKEQLICSNPRCPEKKPTGWNPLRGCVWVEEVEGRMWSSISKKYVLSHIDEFIKGG